MRATIVEVAATDTPIWDAIDPDGRPDLPDRSAMLSPASVADAILYVLSRPAEVHLPSLAIQRS